MSLISSVTGAAATLAAGLTPETSAPRLIAGQVATGAGGLGSARRPDLISALLDAVGPARTKAAVSKTTAGSGGKAAVAKTTTAKTSTAKTGTTTSGTASSGYAKAAAGGDFAFLKDPTLSVEEKLFRFMCAVAKRNDEEVVRKMEEMKGGAATAAGKAGTSGGAGGTKKAGGFSVWGALKALIPPLGMAAQLVGDARLKSLIGQVSGPVLAAAVTALGMPALAPLALKAGPGLATALLDGKLGGGDAAAAVGAGASAGTSSASGSSTASASGSGKNEQVQMMELQRLVDKQKEMFAMISNILRAQHDTRMAIIGNVR